MTKRLILVPIIAIGLILSAFIASTNMVKADGQGTPDDCVGQGNQFVISSVGGNPDVLSQEVPEGYVVTGVCIKSGEKMFDGNQHSQVLTVNDYYEDGCYKVKGIGSSEVTVKRKFIANDCQGLSHIDVLFGTERGQEYVAIDKEWEGDDIDLDGVNVTFFIGETEWHLGDLPVPVEPGETYDLSEEVTGLPENCTYSSDLQETFTVPEKNGNYEVLNLNAIDLPEPKVHEVPATNTVECEEGEVLAEEDTPEGAVDAGAGSFALLGLAASVATLAAGAKLARKQTN